ncbi:MAG: hypothetical protein EAX96_12755 [Candidatus Lokiarchaeota archaeon]|nr:hypothetical protein [Candidatus Lokiarchaeota archaeon]
MDLELDDFKPKFQDQEQRYNDYYCTMHFIHNGKENFAKFAFVDGTLMGDEKAQYQHTDSPLILKNEDDIQIIEPESSILIDKLQAPNSLNWDEKDNIVTLKMDQLTFSCSEKEIKITSNNETLGGDITFTPRGRVFRWGYKKGELVKLTNGTEINGIEQLCDFRGKLRIKGEEIEVEGRGIFEHVWFNKLSFLKIRMVDWLYMNFDQMTSFICHVESISEDGTPYHFETGTIHLLQQNDFLITKKIEFEPKNWVFLKELWAFIPKIQKVRVKTDKGTLKLKIELSLYPKLSKTLNRRIEFLTLHNLTGWRVLFYDVILKISGKFTYKDGKVIKLTNGTGVNEQIRVSPL